MCQMQFKHGSLSSLSFVPFLVVCALLPSTGAPGEEAPDLEPQAQTAQPVPSAEDAARAADSAQEIASTPVSDWRVTLGVGAMYRPAFPGSKDYQVMAFPNLKLEYRDLFFASVYDGIGINALNKDGWRAGPILKLNFGRPDDGDSPFRIGGGKTNALRGLGDVDPTLELGGFVEYSYKPVSAKLELRQGLGGHEGLIGEAGLSYRGSTTALGPPLLYSLGPRLTFADSSYNQAFFGITRAQSIRSGLAKYSPDSGLVSYGVGGFLAMPVSESVSVGLLGGYDRLESEAADSPLVRRRGDEDQFMFSLGLSYKIGR